LDLWVRMRSKENLNDWIEEEVSKEKFLKVHDQKKSVLDEDLQDRELRRLLELRRLQKSL